MDIKEYIRTEKKKLGRSIVATPETREYLENFTKACGGSNNIVAMQMAIQFGYIAALDDIENKLKE